MGSTMNKFVDKFYLIFATAIGALILGISLLLVIDAVGRYAADEPLLGGVEISIILMSFVIFGSYSFALYSGAHVRITVLTRHFSPKLQALGNILVSLLGIAFLGVLTYASWGLFWESWQVSETMRAPIELPRWLLKLALFGGFFLFTMQFVVNLVEHVRGLVKVNEE